MLVKLAKEALNLPADLQGHLIRACVKNWSEFLKLGLN